MRSRGRIASRAGAVALIAFALVVLAGPPVAAAALRLDPIGTFVEPIYATAPQATRAGCSWSSAPVGSW